MNIRLHISLIVLMAACSIAEAIPQDTLTVKVLGMHENARFEPAVIQIEPGDVIRFEVKEGLHTVTAYHPDNRRPMRIPEGAKSFDSGPLKAGQIWLLNIEMPGVYDYFCMPHERMGHAGRIISGPTQEIPNYPTGRIPEPVLLTLENETQQFLTQITNTINPNEE